ncbi:DUF362 domain-containing protein [bacterium]|nr:DUF362 domain-containing protein [bacterium]
MNHKVVLYFSDKGRYHNLKQALDLLKKDILKSSKNKKEIILKPNLVNENYPLGLTHKDALQALIDFFDENKVPAQISIAEDCAIGDTWRAMYKQKYFELNSSRSLNFQNLKFAETKEVNLFNHNLEQSLKQHIYKDLTGADFLVSVALPKTHDSVVVTLSLKNVLVGGILEKAGRGKTIHQGYTAINHSLVELTKYIYPDLGIIDGWISMEGEGPSRGTPKKTHFAACSLEPLALDLIVAKIMGFEIKDSGYLYLLSKQKKITLQSIEVLSNKNWQKINFAFKPHPSFEEQIKWKA